jgi:hypothetical protein
LAYVTACTARGVFPEKRACTDILAVCVESCTVEALSATCGRRNQLAKHFTKHQEPSNIVRARMCALIALLACINGPAARSCARGTPWHQLPRRRPRHQALCAGPRHRDVRIRCPAPSLGRTDWASSRPNPELKPECKPELEIDHSEACGMRHGVCAAYRVEFVEQRGHVILGGMR